LFAASFAVQDPITPHRALRTATAAKDAARGGQHGGPERYQSHSMKAVRRSQTASTETKLARYSRSRRWIVAEEAPRRSIIKVSVWKGR